MADTRRHLERLLAAHSYNHTRLQSFKCSSLRSHVLPLLLVIVFLSSLSPSLEAEAAGSVRQVVKLGFLLPYPKADHVIPLRLADEWYAPRSRIAASRVALEVLGPKYSNAFDVVPHIAPPTANHSLSLPSSHSLNALVQDRSDSSIKGRSGGARAPEYSDAFDVVPHIALPTANTLYPSHSYHPTCSGLQHQEWLWRIAASRVALEVLAPKYSDAFDVVPHIANSNCDRQEAKEAAQLLLRDGVVGVVGPACTEAALGAADVLVPAGVPIVSFAATWDGFRDRERFGSFFRTVFGDRHQAAAMRSLLQEFVFERVILFFTEDTYGSALGYDIEYFARSDNLAVHSIPVPVPCSNYSSLFLNLSDPSPSKPLIQAGDSTVVVLAVSPNAAGGIWRAALDLPLIQADDSDERLGGAWGCLKATTIVVLAPRGLTQCSRGHLACGSRPGEGYPLQIWSLQYPPHPSTPLLAPPRPSPPLPAPPRPSTPLNAPHSFTRFPILPSPPLRKPPGSVGISVVVFRHGWSSGIRPWWEGQNLSALTSALQGEMGVAPYKGDYSDSSPIWEYIMHWRTKRHDIYPGLLTLDVGPSLPRFNTTRQYVPYLFDAIHAFFEAFSSIIANQNAAPTKELVLACFKGVLRGCINFTGTTGQVSFNPATGERLKSVAPPTYSIALPPTIPIHPFTTTSYRRAIEICSPDRPHCGFETSQLSSHRPHPPLHHNQVSFNPATGERLKSVAPPTYSIALPPTIPIHPFTTTSYRRAIEICSPDRPHCRFETSQLSSHRPHPPLHHNQVSFTPATAERLKSVAPTDRIVVLRRILQPGYRRAAQDSDPTDLQHCESGGRDMAGKGTMGGATRGAVHSLHPPPSHDQVSFNPATGERLKSVAPPTYSIVNLEGVTWKQKARWEERHVERFTLDLSQISRPGPLPGAAGAGAGAGGGSGGGTSGGAGNGSAAGVKEAGDYSAPAVFDALNQVSGEIGDFGFKGREVGGEEYVRRYNGDGEWIDFPAHSGCRRRHTRGAVFMRG
ncbi:unnamed protein product [Closterium sp. Naga37s-1]|nr:unnamed protein product [Closterium sp. Naga37s-1]